MAEKSTIARPYAKAVFDLAESQGKFKQWSNLLSLITLVVSNPLARISINNAKLTKDQIADLIIGTCGNDIDSQGENFVKLLVEYRRLNIMEEIATQYENLRAIAERRIDAKLESAFEISSNQQEKIKKALKKRLGRDVELTVKIHKSLVGGAVIRAGDLVIDGSAAGRLQKLVNALS